MTAVQIEHKRPTRAEKRAAKVKAKGDRRCTGVYRSKYGGGVMQCALNRRTCKNKAHKSRLRALVLKGLIVDA